MLFLATPEEHQEIHAHLARVLTEGYLRQLSAAKCLLQKLLTRMPSLWNQGARGKIVLVP